jgi:hypothetical protein
VLAAALSALLLSAAPRPEAAASAGGGYDSNLNLGDPVSAVGAGFAALRASGGASLDLGEATNVYGGVRFDDEEYPALPGLTTRTAGVELSLARDLGEHAALVVTPWAGVSWAGDPARDATTLAGQLTLRVKPGRTLALRATYGHTSRAAADPVFSSERDRLGASVEWRVLRRTFLSLGGAVERGDEVFYRDASRGGVGMGRMSEAFGRGQEAYRVPATSRAIGPALEVGLDRTFHLLASYELRLVRAAGAEFPTQSAFFGLGARL